MNKIRVWSVVAVLVAVAIPLGVSAEVSYTIGEFAVNLTKMITQKSELSAEESVAYLEKLGVELDANLDSQVTEAVLVDAFDQIGIELRTSSPDRAVSDSGAQNLFKMFDPSDALFSGEVFKLCKGGIPNQNSPCVSDADCPGGFCQVLPSIKCQGGTHDEEMCETDSDCPDGRCNIPPGQAKKLGIASPLD